MRDDEKLRELAAAGSRKAAHPGGAAGLVQAAVPRPRKLKCFLV
jgi:hypothetical protein